jgi:hypothetical protein
MKMLRSDLVNALEIADAARSSKTVTPLLTHFWFRDDVIVCFNDAIALSVPFKSNFVGAVPGAILTLLKTSHVKEMTIASNGESATFKAGDAKLKLQTMSLSDADKILIFPKTKGEPIEFENSKEFMRVLSYCMISVGTDTSSPDTVGVTLIPDGDYLRMYSTNDNTLSAGEVLVNCDLNFKRVILCAEFCKQLLKLGSEREFDLWVSEDFSLAKIYGEDEDDGTILLYGRLLESSNPIPFKALLERHAPPEVVDQFIPRPLISQAIDRALIIAGTGADEVRTRIDIRDGDIELLTQGKISQVEDYADIAKKHADVRLRLAIKWLRLGYDQMPADAEIVFREDAIVMMHESKPKKGKAKTNLLFIISAGK